MSRITVASITQIETIVNVDEVPVPYVSSRSMPNTIFTEAGGDAFNESLAFTWLGDEVNFLSIVGRNQDMSVLNPSDRKVTISTEHILPIAEATATQVILCGKDRKKQVFEDIKDLRDVAYDMSMVTPLIASSELLVVANANFCRPFLDIAAKYKIPVAVNMHTFEKEKEQYNEDFLKAASILYVDDDCVEDDPFGFMKEVAEKYDISVMVMGQGNKGLILYDRNQNIHVHYDCVKTNEVVNSVGAGNALFACFLHYYVETKDSVNAIKNALLFASYKVGFMGTSNGFMTVDEVAQWRQLIWGMDKTPEKIANIN